TRSTPPAPMTPALGGGGTSAHHELRPPAFSTQGTLLACVERGRQGVDRERCRSQCVGSEGSTTTGTRASEQRKVCTHPFFLYCALLMLASTASARGERMGAGPKLEASFELVGVTGNPFDDTENDVRVTFRGPRGEITPLPAFFDGGSTWR